MRSSSMRPSRFSSSRTVVVAIEDEDDYAFSFCVFDVILVVDQTVAQGFGLLPEVQEALGEGEPESHEAAFEWD